MKKVLALFAAATMTAALAQADSKAFRNIIGDAANIQMDAQAMAADLDNKKFDEAKFRQDSDALIQHIADLKADAELLDSSLNSLTPEQQKGWDLAKTKVQLLDIYANLKRMQLETGDPRKNRDYLRNNVRMIAERAALLQRTVNRLDR